MLCPICLNPASLIGRKPDGRRRWHCLECNRTFTARGRQLKTDLAADAATRLRLLGSVSRWYKSA